MRKKHRIINTLKLKEYEEIKKKMVVRLYNADINVGRLQDSVRKEIGDIAIAVFYRDVDADGRKVLKAVTKSMAEEWDVSADDIVFDALENFCHIDPPRIYRSKEILFSPEYHGQDLFNDDIEITAEDGIVGLHVTNVSGRYGAATIFHPAVAKRVLELLQSTEIYLAFNSENDVTVFGDKKKPREVADLLRRQNLINTALFDSTPLSLSVIRFRKK